MTRPSLYLLLAAILICAGCATGAKPEAMTAVLTIPVHQSPSTVAVSVLGGRDTSAMGASQISDEDFATALRQSIEQSKLFARVSDEGTTNYQLQAFITQVNHPYFGASMTVSMEVDYTLSRTQPKQTVWHKTMTSSYTAPFSAAFVGATRLRLAMEGAARRNIEQAIQEISQLRLE
jgi:hypothetical protein